MIQSDFNSFLSQKVAFHCWAGLNDVLKKQELDSKFAQWLQQCINMAKSMESQSHNSDDLARRAGHLVKVQRDYFGSSFDIGGYLAIYVYIHCMAFDVINFEELFIENWDAFRWACSCEGLHDLF